MAELFVTNFNKNFTGVSATAANVIRQQAKHHDLRLVGYPLPGCPDPITPSVAHGMSRTAPDGRPFAIWHVRRNPEMRSAIWLRDIRRAPIKIVKPRGRERFVDKLKPRNLLGMARGSAMLQTIVVTEKRRGHMRLP